MNQCKHCGIETKNPKFCSISCSAKHHNNAENFWKQHTPKTYGSCIICGKTIVMRNAKSFCSHKCYSQYRWNQIKEKIEQSGYVHDSSNFHSSKSGRRYLIEKHGHKCSICGITEWMNQPTPLVLDHINGKPNDWAISNIRLVCPNCDAQLPTYKSKNKNGGRPHRRIPS